jgi:acyl-CoA synthetase (AMP-forming)/AMP-acid ligase II|eukprot:COSAG01_NODE_659_length_14436_cov_15.108112_8_plen_63_part_00
MSAVNTLGVRAAAKEFAGKGKLADGPQQVALTPVPLFHVTGSHAIFLNAVLNGSKLVLMFKW